MNSHKKAQETLTWEHQRWESIVREHLHNFDYLSVDEVLRHIMATVADDPSEASRALEVIFEEDYEAFMYLVEEVLESIGKDQKHKDTMNNTDYTWEKEVLSSSPIIIDFKYTNEQSLNTFLDFVIQETQKYQSKISKYDILDDGEVTFEVRASSSIAKEHIEAAILRFSKINS